MRAKNKATKSRYKRKVVQRRDKKKRGIKKHKTETNKGQHRQTIKE